MSLDYRRLSASLAGIAAASLVAACSGDDGDLHSLPDAGTSMDAASGADVTNLLEAGAEGDSTSPLDAANVGDGTTADETDDAADAVSTDGSVADGTPDTLVDVVISPDAPTADDDAADAAMRDESIPDGPADASSDTTMSAPDTSTSDVTAADSATSDESSAEGSADAMSEWTSSPDASTSSGDAATATDAASDANDAVAGALLDYTFDSSNQGWWLLKTISPNPSNVTTNSLVKWSGTAGDPPGSLELYAAFDDSGEKLQAGISFPSFVDLTGRTVSMDLFLAGGSQEFSYFYVFCQDESTNWIDAGSTPFPPVPGGQWMTVSLNVSHPQGYTGFPGQTFDTTHIQVIGVELDSGSGAGPGSITPVTVYIDNVVVQ